MSQQTVELPQGKVAYRDEGEGPVILFSHGVFVDSSLWDGLVERLVPAGFRCVRPETPMGAHRIPLKPDTPLSPPKVADLLADFIDVLELGPVTVVGSDSGGAISQMLAARHPEKVAAMVLTNCDALDVYPPFPFNFLPPLARMPGGIAPLGLLMKAKPIRWATFRLLTAEPIPDAQLKAWLRPPSTNPAIRRDVDKVIGGLEKNQANEAAETLRNFDKPVLFTWGVKDRFFRLELAERLAAMLPDARIARIEGGRTFVALDDPAEVSRLIVEFMNERVAPSGRSDAEGSTLAGADGR